MRSCARRQRLQPSRPKTSSCSGKCVACAPTPCRRRCKNGTGKPELTGVAVNLSNFLRSALPADRYDIVSAEITEMAARNTSGRMTMGWMLRSDYVVSGVLHTRNASFAVLTIFTDVRGGHYSRVAETVALTNDASAVFDLTLSRVNGWLDSARARASNGAATGRRSGKPAMQGR